MALRCTLFPQQNNRAVTDSPLIRAGRTSTGAALTFRGVHLCQSGVLSGLTATFSQLKRRHATPFKLPASTGAPRDGRVLTSPCGIQTAEPFSRREYPSQTMPSIPGKTRKEGRAGDYYATNLLLKG
jgi:hypothetical protein